MHPQLLDTIAVKLRLRHLDLIITIQSQKVLKNWYYAKSEFFLTQALISLWLRNQPYLKALSQSCLVIPNFWGTLQVTLKRKKASRCKNRDCPILIITGASINEKIESFTTITSYTTSSRVQNCFPRLDSSWTTQEETWNGLISPSHFVHLEVWIQMNSMPWKTCFTSKSKTSYLVKIDWKCLATEILDAKYEQTDVIEVMKGLTHLNAHQKADLPWVLQENKKIKRCLMKPLRFIHIKRYTLTLINKRVNRHHPHSPFQRRTTEYAGSVTHINWTKS